MRERYEQEILPALIGKFGYSTPMQAPRLVKITLNMGLGEAKQNNKMLEAAQEQLATIAGQQPNVRRISSVTRRRPMRFSAGSIFSTRTSTSSPTFTTSRGCAMRRFESAETWIRPSTPGLQLHEGAERLQADDLALEPVALLDLRERRLARILLPRAQATA